MNNNKSVTVMEEFGSFGWAVQKMAATMLKALENHKWHENNIVMLDCYNNVIMTESVAITTRIDACNHYYIMSIYENTDKTGNK